MKKIIVAIDGYSSCGKSTMARQLASALGYRYVDTGAMYRAVTLFFLRNQIDFLHSNLVVEALKNIDIDFEFDDALKIQRTLLNHENIEDEIRLNPRVASAVSDVSALAEVRHFLVNKQQEMGKRKGIVMDGRDIGTVVFPEAELKLFITAVPEIRAKRRYEELLSKGIETTLGEVNANLQKRDLIDSTRTESPLRKADDAIEIDNSYLTPDEQLTLILKIAHERKTQASASHS